MIENVARTTLTLLLAVVCFVLLAASSASAWTSSVDAQGVLTLDAALGEVNVMAVADQGPEVVIDDQVANVLAGAIPGPCQAADVAELRCDRSQISRVVVNAGDGNDTISSATVLAVSFFGQVGNDTLLGSAAADVLD